VVRASPSSPLAGALCSLEGLSVGDAFGERFFVDPGLAAALIHQRVVAEPPWRYTDDTEMALSIVSVLTAHGEIEQIQLASSFAEHHDWSRGYGAGMHSLLIRIGVGAPWEREAQRQFGGQGSFGNGAAMRVAPIGAYFADDLDRVVEQARRSAVVTHAHPEGVAGAIAVAVAAALARTTRRLRSIRISGSGTAAMTPSAAATRPPSRAACSRQSRSRRSTAGR